ncbi:MAG: twin-arginine translocase subunit TatC [Proteobacteria bacterium]|jgi:sec-independent protein translocase protein TatC|nr:twin-arginine translocase subunit TatC [Pseudomonadota bacterium]
MSLGDKQTLIEHLTELRSRLIRIAWGIFLGLIVCYYFSEKIFEVVRAPILPYLPEGGLVFTGPADKFIAHIKVSIFGGILLTTPFWLYQIWSFVSPALYKKEKRIALGFILSGSLLFILGVLFSYYLMLPTAFEFLLGFGGTMDKPMITIDAYLSFFLMTSLAFGLSFELPLVLVLLGMFGVVSSSFLSKNRRYAALVLAFVAAIVTPQPDAFSMLMMLLPLMALYEISVGLVRFFEKKASKLKDQTASDAQSWD